VTDILSFNQYIGWYDGTPEQCAAIIRWKISQDKPVIISEFGADAKFGFMPTRSLVSRGISGISLYGNAENAEHHPAAERHLSVDPCRFPLAAPSSAEHPGRMEPEGTVLGKGREKESVLYFAEILFGKSIDEIIPGLSIIILCPVRNLLISGTKNPINAFLDKNALVPSLRSG
jgi:hypothetical protein